MRRTTIELAAYGPRNRVPGALAVGVLLWSLLSPLPIAILSVFEGFHEIIRWHWWLPAAAYALAVVLNVPTPHIPVSLVGKLDRPDGSRVGRGDLFGYGLGAAMVVMGQSIAISYDDPWLAVFGGGPLPAVEPAAWALLGAAAVVALRSLAGTLGWVPAGWGEITEEDFRTAASLGQQSSRPT